MAIMSFYAVKVKTHVLSEIVGRRPGALCMTMDQKSAAVRMYEERRLSEIGLARYIKDQIMRGIECCQAFHLQQRFAAGFYQRSCLTDERHLEHGVMAVGSCLCPAGGSRRV